MDSGASETGDDPGIPPWAAGTLTLAAVLAAKPRGPSMSDVLNSKNFEEIFARLKEIRLRDLHMYGPITGHILMML